MQNMINLNLILVKKSNKKHRLYFTKDELTKILQHYAMGVSKGRWKDYSMNFTNNEAFFNFHRVIGCVNFIHDTFDRGFILIGGFRRVCCRRFLSCFISLQDVDNLYPLILKEWRNGQTRNNHCLINFCKLRICTSRPSNRSR